MDTRNIVLLIFAIINNWSANGELYTETEFNQDGEPKNIVTEKVRDIILKNLAKIVAYRKTKAVNNFDQNSTEKIKTAWTTPEICTWGDAILKMAPEHDICNIVAVKISTMKPTSIKDTQLTRHYVPYDCLELPVDNVKAKSTKQTAMYCPTTLIEEPLNGTATGRDLTRIRRFLIGQGNYRPNSIYVYFFNNQGKSMNLVFYMQNVLTDFMMKIDEEEYREHRAVHKQNRYQFHGFRNAVENFEKIIDNATLQSNLFTNECHKNIEETFNTCKNLSVLRMANYLVKTTPNLVQDVGFIPYVCVNRPIMNIEPQNAPNKVRSMIFCPEQIILGIQRPAFLYSVGNIYGRSYFTYEIEFERVKVKRDDKAAVESDEEATNEEAESESIEETKNDEDVAESIEETKNDEAVAESIEETKNDEAVAESIEETKNDEAVAESIEETKNDEAVAESIEETKNDEAVAKSVEEAVEEEEQVEILESISLSDYLTWVSYSIRLSERHMKQIKNELQTYSNQDTDFIFDKTTEA